MSLRAIWIETPVATLAAEVEAVPTDAALIWAPTDQFVKVRRRLPIVLEQEGQRLMGMALWGFADLSMTSECRGCDFLDPQWLTPDDARRRCLIPMDCHIALGAWGGTRLLHNRWSRWALGFWRHAGHDSWTPGMQVRILTETMRGADGWPWPRPVMTGVVTPDQWLQHEDLDALRLASQNDETQHAWSWAPIDIPDGLEVTGSFAGVWPKAERMPRHVHGSDPHLEPGQDPPRIPWIPLRGWVEARHLAAEAALRVPGPPRTDLPKRHGRAGVGHFVRPDDVQPL